MKNILAISLFLIAAPAAIGAVCEPESLDKCPAHFMDVTQRGTPYPLARENLVHYGFDPVINYAEDGKSLVCSYEDIGCFPEYDGVAYPADGSPYINYIWKKGKYTCTISTTPEEHIIILEAFCFTDADKISMKK